MTKKVTSIPVQFEAESSTANAPLLSLTQNQFTSSSTGSMELVGLRERKPMKVSEFEAQYRQPEDQMTVTESVKKVVMKKWSKFSLRKVVVSNFPILSVLRRYRLTHDLPNDMVAGLTAGIMMIPQGLAFASLSTLQPIIGLYISLFSSLTYFFLGTGQQSSFGCIAILSIMMGSILDKYENQVRQSAGEVSCSAQLATTSSSALAADTGSSTTFSDFSGASLSMMETTLASDIASDPLDLEAKKLGVAGGVTLLCGVILIILGKVGFGKLTIFMSDSLVTGVTVGAAFHVGSSQLKTIFGLTFLPRESGIFKLMKLWYSILAHIHRSNIASIIASLICILIIYLVKRFVNEKYKNKLRVPVPVELIVMILATVISYYADLYTKFGISIVKQVPTGVPKPLLPDLNHGFDYLTDGLIIILVAFVQTVSVAKIMGFKHNYKVDANQEMFALGMVNVMCGVFSGYISGASVSRTVVQDSAGGKSQIASLFAALLVLMVMLFIGPYFYYVPKITLSAIIIVSLRSLMLKLLTVPDMWRKSKMDCIMFVTTVSAVVILDADIGILVGIGMSIFLVLFMTIMSSVDVTAHIPVGQPGVWRSKENYYGGQEMTDVKVMRINSPLYFVNAEIITNSVFKKTGVNPLIMTKNKSVEVQPPDTPIPNGTSVMEDAGKMVEKAVVSEMKTDPNLKAVPSNIFTDVEKGENRGGESDNDKRDAKSKQVPAADSVPATSALPFSTLILDMSGASFIDLMGVKALEFLIEKYRGVGVAVYVTNVTERCLDTLKKVGFMARHGEMVLLAVETVFTHLSEAQEQERENTKL